MSCFGVSSYSKEHVVWGLLNLRLALTTKTTGSHLLLEQCTLADSVECTSLFHSNLKGHLKGDFIHGQGILKH